MKNKYISILGSIFMIALRFFDKANILSTILVIGGLTMLVYGIRHAATKRDSVFIAALLSLTYLMRFHGYTESQILNIILGLVIGLIMFAIMSFERIFKRYENQFWYCFIFPTTYLLFMYFTEVVKINMPFRLDTYLSSLNILCQITSVLGIYILDFLLAFTASTLVFILDHKNIKETKKLTIIYISILLIIIIFGLIHLNKMNKEESLKNDTVRIVCVNGPNGYAYKESTTYPTINESIDILRQNVKDAKAKKAEIILYSEESFGIDDIYEATFLNETKNLAKENNIHILLAYEIIDTDNDLKGKGINKICFIDNNGEIVYDYTKHCIIPFIETSEYIKGDKSVESFNLNVHGKTIKITSAICYDTDFDIFMSSMDKDCDLLLVPTWDWDVVKEEHFSVSCLRAISNQTTIVRSTFDGYSAVINSAGEILFKNNTTDSNYNDLLIYDVPIN